MTKRDERKKNEQGSNLSKSSHFKFTFLTQINTNVNQCEFQGKKKAKTKPPLQNRYNSVL